MADADEGFTVIELIIAMLIMLLLMAPLASAFVLGLATTRSGEEDAANSSDAQLLASYFDIDVASAESVQTSSGCGGGGTILELRWTDGSAQRFIAYRAVANSARQAELHLTTPVYDLERVACSSASGPVQDTQTLARTLSASPVVTCDNGKPCTTTPRRVTLAATAYSKQINDQGSTTSFTFGVTAARRVRP